MMYKLICYKDNKVKFDFDLKKSKILLGSANNCDIVINSPTISPYHCFIIIHEDFIKIIDLESTNGTIINDIQIKINSILAINDTITFGNIKFYLQESTSSNNELIQVDQKTSKITPVISNDLISQVKPIENFIIIDGEHCDINFTEPENFHNIQPSINILHLENKREEIFENQEYRNIFFTNNSKRLEITHMIHGNLIEVRSMPLEDGLFTASYDKIGKKIISFYTLEKDLPLFSIRKNNFVISKSKEIIITKKNEHEYSFSHKNETIFIKIKSDIDGTKKVPFYGRDYKFKKDSTLQFALALSVALLLLIFTPEKIVKLDETPIVYKKISITRSKTVASAGSKSSSVFSSFKKKFKKFVKKIKSKPVAQKKPLFTLKLSTNLSKLSATDTKFNEIKSKGASRSIASLDTNHKGSKGERLAKSSLSRVGSGKWGNKKFGLKGYGHKKGFESAYGAPRTVVLGSIDAELLRKIIREHLPQFKRCYQRELDINEKLKGVVGLNFRIQKNGSVSNVSIKSKITKFSNSGSNCMASVLHMISFPKPKGGGVVDVRQPLSFFAENNKI